MIKRYHNAAILNCIDSQSIESDWHVQVKKGNKKYWDKKANMN